MEIKKCFRNFYEKVRGTNHYEKKKKEVSCPTPKKRCEDGELARPAKDGRTVCKDDHREG